MCAFGGFMQRWISASLAVFLVSAGVLVGCVLRLPIIPWTLAPDVANLSGAAFGAIAAVAGAAYLQFRIETRFSRRARVAVGRAVEPFLMAIDAFLPRIPLLS